MDASEASTFNKAVDWYVYIRRSVVDVDRYKGRGHWFSPPTVQYVNGIPTVSTTEPDTWSALPSSLLANATSSSSSWSLRFPSLASLYSVRSRLSSPLADYYRHHIRSTLERLIREEGRKFGALVMEPVCLGAGGMVFVDPLFQACLIEVVRASTDLFGASGSKADYTSDLASLPSRDPGQWQGLPVIYDEGLSAIIPNIVTLANLSCAKVFSGLHRFGYSSAAAVLSYHPDIATYAKILTGGLLPLSATLASTSIFRSFLSDRKVDALLHGHSYTANPIGCAVALKAIEMVEAHDSSGGWEREKGMWGVSDEGVSKEEVELDVDGMDSGRWSFWDPAFVQGVSGVKGVRGAMAMGTVIAIELDDGEGGEWSGSS